MYFDVKSNSKNFFLLAKKNFIFLISYSAIYLAIVVYTSRSTEGS